MTRVLAAGCQPDFRPEHSTAKAFESLLRSFAATSTVERHMRARERFVAAYPDLRVWFRAPLSERLGRFYRDVPGRTRQSVLHGARGYLCFLAYHGYMHLDLEWLIAVPRLDVGTGFAGPALEPEVVKLVDEASALGYERKNADAAIRRALTRILLHKGTTQITEVSDLDCDEYHQALASFSQRPDLRALFGSAQRYKGRWKDYRNNIYHLHTVLFHRGQASKEPRKSMSKPNSRQVLKPRMEAVIQRYLSERALTSRPNTVRHFDCSLRYLAEWLLQEQPSIESFAGVTREHVLQFCESLNHRITVLTKRKWSEYTKRGVMTNLCTFSRDVATLGLGGCADSSLARPLGFAQDAAESSPLHTGS